MLRKAGRLTGIPLVQAIPLAADDADIGCKQARSFPSLGNKRMSNVKQVVVGLAFELWLVWLLVTGTYLLILESARSFFRRRQARPR